MVTQGLSVTLKGDEHAWKPSFAKQDGGNSCSMHTIARLNMLPGSHGEKL